MEKKENPLFCFISYSVTAILLVATSTVLLISLGLNQNHIAMAQEQQPTLEGISF